MINKIWASFLIIGIIFSLFTGKIEVINSEIIECTKTSLELIMQIFPVIALWLGIMKIASESGLLKKITKIIFFLLFL